MADALQFSANITSVSGDGKTYGFDVIYGGSSIASYTARYVNELVQYGRTEGEIIIVDGGGNVLTRMGRQFLTETPTVQNREYSLADALPLFAQDPAVLVFLNTLIS